MNAIELTIRLEAQHQLEQAVRTLYGMDYTRSDLHSVINHLIDKISEEAIAKTYKKG